MIDTISKSPDEMCRCGKPRLKTFVKWANRWIHSKWCEECEKKAIEHSELAEEEERKNVIRRAIIREIEPIYYKSSLKDFNEQIVEILNKKPEGKSVFIWGSTGTGKSHLASAMVKQALVAGLKAKMIRFKDMLLAVRASYDSKHTEEAVYRKFINCDLLSIEDVGTVKSGNRESDFSQDTLLTVIDARLQRYKPTIITTNLSPEAVWDSFGDRLGSRFSTFLTFKLEGRDRRLPE